MRMDAHLSEKEAKKRLLRSLGKSLNARILNEIFDRLGKFPKE